MKKTLIIVIIAMLSACFAMDCFSKNLTGKKVLYVDSYHQGYGWSDGIALGVKNAVSPSGAGLKTLWMDTKRHTDDAFKKEAALKVKAEIEAFQPDVVIAADDNASKFLVMPYYKDAGLPFVFCGVNWDAAVYGYPYKNVTGMVEVTPAPQLIEQLEKFAKGDKIGFLAPDTITGKKEAANWEKAFGMTLKTYYSTDFSDWKKGFKTLQEETDILVLDTDGGLYHDNAGEMKAFVEANVQKPIGTTYDFMAPYALITFAKMAQEQGYWAGEAAVRILSGTAPVDIPIVKNKEGQLILNARIANALGLELPFELVENAARVIE